MLRNTPRASTFIVALTLAIGVNAQESRPKQVDSYYVLLHSRSLVEQRKALTAVINDPQAYIPRIQQSLRDYPRMLRTDPVAANRAVYVSALVRDPSFPPILVKQLGNANVLEECTYPCPVVFALTVQAGFAGWRPPTNLDSQLTTVEDLRSSMRNLSHLSLKVGSIDDVVQGPMLEKHREEIEGKTEEQLIRMAGSTGGSYEIRFLAASRLETLIADSRNRAELYLLALNEVRDASGEYRDSVYQAIYRAELAKARSESVAPTH